MIVHVSHLHTRRSHYYISCIQSANNFNMLNFPYDANISKSLFGVVSAIFENGELGLLTGYRICSRDFFLYASGTRELSHYFTCPFLGKTRCFASKRCTPSPWCFRSLRWLGLYGWCNNESTFLTCSTKVSHIRRGFRSHGNTVRARNTSLNECGESLAYETRVVLLLSYTGSVYNGLYLKI